MLKEPKINSVLNILALSEVTVEVTDVEVTNGSAVDAGAPGEGIVTVDYKEIANVDAGFVELQESIDQGVWTTLCVFALSDGPQHRSIQRKARYLRYSSKIDFTQPAPETPVDSNYILSVKVLQ